MSIIRSRRLAGLALAVALSAPITAAVAPAVGAETVTSSTSTASTTYQFVPVRLITFDIEDWWPDWQDEIYMYYGDQTFGASSWNGNVMHPQAATFTGSSLRVDLWEWDRGRNNNWLGGMTVTSNDLDLEKTVDFFRPGDFHYQLVYKVVAL